MTGNVREFTGATDDAIRAYEADGVVCLRGCFGSRWLQLARRGIEADLHRRGRFFRDHTPPGSRGRYLFGFWSWPEVPALRELVLDSPAGALAGRLMTTPGVRMVMDNWFVREAGACNAAPWHHDEPYFDFEGRLCILWMPLDAARCDETLSFVRGSHRWGRLFVARQFSDNVPFECSGNDYAPVPDVDATVQPSDRLGASLEPGDCLVFDFRTLHAAASSEPAARTSRRMTLRFAAEGARFRPRGPWTREISDYLLEQGQTPDAGLDCPLLPQVWTRDRGVRPGG